MRFIGFLLGGGVPVTYGVYMLGVHYAYVASLSPGEAACGMGALGGLGLILVAGPIGSLVGLTAGMVMAWSWKCLRRFVIEGSEES